MRTKTKPTNSNSNNKKDNIHPYEQINLPSEYSIYRQLIQQLGIKSKEQQARFRNNFKAKYLKHLSMIQQNNDNIHRFNVSRERQLLEKQKKINEIKEYIDKKQEQANDKRNINSNEMKNRIKKSHHKWQEVINKNKHQYLNNLKKSMKLVKRWEKKLSHSVEKKNQLLQQVTQQAQEHNQHITNVLQRTRLNQSREAERNIQILEQTLAIDAEKKKRSSYSKLRNLGKISKVQLNNPQGIRYKTPQKHHQFFKNNKSSIIQRFKTQSSNLKNYEQPNSLPLKFQSINRLTPIYHQQLSPPHSSHPLDQRSRMKEIRSIDNSRFSSISNHLKTKNQLQQQKLSISLLKNVQKQQRIVQARHLKSYLQNHRTKVNKQKQLQFTNKVRQNIQKLQNENLIKNKKLDEKYYGKLINNQQQDNSYHISLPVLNSKRNKSPWEHDKDKQAKYQHRLKSFTQIRGRKFQFLTQINQTNQQQKNIYPKINQKHKKRPYKNINLSKKYAKINQIEEYQTVKQDNSTKYNRQIMDKLRNISLIANLKNKKQTQSDRNGKQMRKKIQKNSFNTNNH